MPATQELTLEQLSAFARRQAAEFQHLSFKKPLRDCKVAIVAHTKENFVGARSPDGRPWLPLRFPRASGRGGALPLRDTGILQASLSTGSREGHIEQLTDTLLIFGTNLEHARIHQEGGTIRPTRGQFLAIPITPEAWQAGNARDFPEPLVAIVGRSGRGGVLVEKEPPAKKRRRKKKEPAPRFVGGKKVHYILTKSVTIPARPFLGFSPPLIQDIEDIFGDFLEQQFAEAPLG